MRRACLLVLSALFLCLPLSAQTALSYSNVVVFGDSLSDTGDFYATASALGVAYPSPTYAYTAGRFTDGADTTPAARAYFGVWHEQLNRMLPGVPVANAALCFALASGFCVPPGSSGGTGFNYAFGDATTAGGTTAIALGPATLNVRNMGQQVTDYLAANKPSATALYIVFGGGNDFLQNNAANPATVAANESAIIQKLVAAGAVNFLVPNLPPLGDPTTQLGQDAITFRAALTASMTALQAQYMASGTPFHLVQVDLFTSTGLVLANPTAYGIVNTTAAANTLPATANPDTYLSWDGLHPTTSGHGLIAVVACSAMTMTRVALTASTAVATTATGGTLTATVSNANTFGTPSTTATPTGSVTFYSVTTSNSVTSYTSLGSAPLSAQGVATLASTSIPQGIYSVVAVYSGDGTFPVGCRTAPVAFTVANTNPGFVLMQQNQVPTAAAGSNVSTQVGALPVGSFSGTVAIACGTLPLYFTCTVSNSPVTVSAAGATTYATVLLGTSVTTTGAVRNPFAISGVRYALLFAPLLLLGLRRRKLSAGLLALACGVVLTGASGCGGAGGTSITNAPVTVTHTAASGTYTVPIVGTSSTGLTATTNFVVTLK